MAVIIENDSVNLPEQGSAPATPDTGRQKLYFGTDGYLYAVDDAGSAVRLQPTADQATALATYEAALAAAEDGQVLTGDGAGGAAFEAPAGPKIYFASITQFGPLAPVVTEYKNQIGTAVWTRTNTGIYTIAASDIVSQSFVAVTPVATASASYIRATVTAGQIEIRSYNSSNALADGLLNHYIKIDVYD